MMQGSVSGNTFGGSDLGGGSGNSVQQYSSDFSHSGTPGHSFNHQATGSRLDQGDKNQGTRRPSTKNNGGSQTGSS